MQDLSIFHCFIHLDQPVFRKPTIVWIVGSSLVKNAFTEARQRPGGSNLCLENIDIWWQGKSGMRASQLGGKIQTMLRYEDPPNYLLIHVGANDIGNRKVGDLRNYLTNVVTQISDIDA